MTTTTDTTTGTEALAALVVEDATLAAQAEHITTRRAEIRAILADRLPVGTTDLAGHHVAVTTPRRLDPVKLAAAYPVTLHPELYEPKLSTKAVKAAFAPDVLDAFKIVGDRQVTIR